MFYMSFHFTVDFNSWRPKLGSSGVIFFFATFALHWACAYCNLQRLWNVTGKACPAVTCESLPPHTFASYPLSPSLPPWWIIQHWQRGGGGSHVYNSAENWTIDHLTSSIPATHLCGPARCCKHRECFSLNCWFDITSHTLISSHIGRRLSE